MTDDNQSKPHSSSKDQRDEFELDLALAEYVDQLNAGLALDYERIKAEHPQIAAELLSRLEAFQEIEIEFGQCEPLGTLGDYTLRRQIGRGGMGVVYEAWQASVERQVALKVLPAGIAADPRAVSRFAREARVAAKIQHPNVVSVFGMGVEAETPYYAMLTGQSPRRLLRS